MITDHGKPRYSLLVGLITFSAAVIVVYILWVFTRHYQVEVENIISAIILIGLMLATAGISFIVALNKKTILPLRRAWLFMGLAALSNAIAESLWLWFGVGLKIEVFPSVADVFFLLFYPLMLAGILFLPYIPVQNERRAIFGLDMAIVLVMGIIFLWYFILAPTMSTASEGISRLIALAYPIGDLLILAGFLSLIQRDTEKINRATIILLCVSMFFTGIADVLFAVVETHTGAYLMPPLNMFWMISYWTMLIAAAWQLIHPASNLNNDGFKPLFRDTLIYIAPVLSFSLVLFPSHSLLFLNKSSTWTIIGSFVIFTLVLVRQYIVIRDNRRLYSIIEKQAITDALTGLYNRHYFIDALRREMDRANRFGRPLSILMIDVDNLKSYNDAHGHLQGDALLKLIADQMKSQLRASDLLSRIGGDEFVLILPETDLTQAQVIIERLRTGVRENLSATRMGISIGGAMLKTGMTSQAFLEEADRDLYRMKHDNPITK